MKIKKQQKIKETYRIPPCILVRPIAKELVSAAVCCTITAALTVAEVCLFLNGGNGMKLWEALLVLPLFACICIVIEVFTVPSIQKLKKCKNNVDGIIYWLMAAMKNIKEGSDYNAMKAEYYLGCALEFVQNDKGLEFIRRIIYDMSSKNPVYFDKLMNGNLRYYSVIFRNAASSIAAGHLRLSCKGGKSSLDHLNEKELLEYLSKLKDSEHSGR